MCKLQKQLKLIKNNKGQSLLEVILALAIFALISSTMISLSVGSFIAMGQGGEQTEAEFLAQEGLEAVRAIHDRAWNEIIHNQSGVETAGSEWDFSGEGTTEVIGDYIRTIFFADVCRDSADDIVDCPGNYNDLHTKKVTSRVSWVTGLGKDNSVEQVAYLTNWDSSDWMQTDWSGGNGQSTWFDEDRYSSDDGNIDYTTNGEIKLASTGGAGGCTAGVWSFDNAGDYNYDTNKIEVIGSFAQLKGGTSSCSGTVNDCTTFTDQTNCENQQSCLWDLADCSGSPTVCGSLGVGDCATCGCVSESGGCVNLDGVDCSSSPGNSDCTPCSAFGCSWSKGSCVGTLDCTSAIDEASCTSCDSCSWVGASSCSGTPSVCTTYSDETNCSTCGCTWDTADCYGTADDCTTFTDQINCENQQGCSWSAGSYPTDNPAINPTTSHTVDSVNAWSSFTETATKNGTSEIYYQLSSDGGSTWQYWDGATWAVAGSADYNLATTINTNIQSFATSTASIMFKAFLESDGTDQVQLDEVRIECGSDYNWPFDLVENYVYDTEKIEVISSVAQLKGDSTCFGTAEACTTFTNQTNCESQDGCSWGGGSTTTNNPDFSTDASGWLFSTWGFDTGEVTPTGNWQASGGDTGGYVDINIPFNARDDLIGGYWEQSVVVTLNNATLTCSFDWSITSWTTKSGVDDYQFYVFLDNASGEPTIGNEIWSSGTQNGVIAWSGQQNIDCSAFATTAGTYYLKLAVWLDALNANTGPIIAGYDNASVTIDGASCSGTATACDTYLDQTTCQGQSGCNWGGSSYPTDNPTIMPTSAYSVSGLSQYSGFTEIATKNGTSEIYYQLSGDGGTNWQYWNGSTWTNAGVTNYNLATTVSTNISSFATTTGSIMFKAFLESNGTDQVQLDNVKISWDGAGGGESGYPLSAYLISSAFDMTNISPVQIISWSEIVPTGCDIQAQLRTAPDSGGVPGIWTSWYGASGANTYFTNPDGTLVSTDLNTNQWVQYRVELTGDGTNTPVLEDIFVNYK